MRGWGPRESCGICGVWGHPEASKVMYHCLYALQHRGQECAGIVSTDGERMFSERGMGLVSEVFDEARISQLAGHAAIGHCRYSTTGSSVPKNVQPFMADTSRGLLAIGHNGNLTNARRLRDELEAHGSLFQTTMDSEIIVHLVARPGYRDLREALAGALAVCKGAYSLVLLNPDNLIAVRDPNGFRPLSIGRLGDAWVFASETCALDLVQASYVREVEPGEIIFVGRDGLRSWPGAIPGARRSFCIFEFIYFARPDSNLLGQSVHEARKELGRNLAREHPADADVVIPVMDGGNCGALGFSEVSGIPFDLGLIRNHYVGRTFIQPAQHIRDFGVKVKFNAVRSVVDGKRVVIVEDSVVRGTTGRQLGRLLREAGAREVHLRVTCPPHRYPCFYGIDFSTRGELIAATRNVEEIRRYTGLDSLGYLSLEGMLKSIPVPSDQLCTACFTGDYPVEPCEGMGKHSLESLHEVP